LVDLEGRLAVEFADRPVVGIGDAKRSGDLVPAVADADPDRLVDGSHHGCVLDDAIAGKQTRLAAAVEAASPAADNAEADAVGTEQRVDKRSNPIGVGVGVDKDEGGLRAPRRQRRIKLVAGLAQLGDDGDRRRRWESDRQQARRS